MKKVLCSLFAAALVLQIGSAFAQPHTIGGSRTDVIAASTAQSSMQ
jgi:branched-subunit amino acid permease